MSFTQPVEAQEKWVPGTTVYVHAHQYVEYVRGKPTLCEHCGTKEGFFDWANKSGQYENPEDYVRLCRPCHRQMDLKPLCPRGHIYDKVDQGNRRCSQCKNLLRRNKYATDSVYRLAILAYNKTKRRETL